jgi:hypothetical protein
MHTFKWTGEVMTPVRFEAVAKAYVAGQRYTLEEVNERSWISHRHEFAWLREAWQNLPEALVEKFPSAEHLRKSALVATGWYREAIIDAGNAKAALRVAAYARGRDEFAHVITRGPTVTVRWARSQRMHGLDRMDKDEFQKSKDDILGWIANLIGVEPERLRGAA